MDNVQRRGKEKGGGTVLETSQIASPFMDNSPRRLAPKITRSIENINYVAVSITLKLGTVS